MAAAVATAPVRAAPGFMVSPLASLSALFEAAQQAAFPTLTMKVSIVRASKPEFGDYQYNSAMGAFKKMKKALKGDCPVNSPVEAANLVLSNIPENDIIDNLEVAGPGFVNITLNFDWVASQAKQIAVNGLGPAEGTVGYRVVVDFSSPNIAKEMHVGHLRSTIIGEAICRMLEFSGHEVLRTNHIGDWGTQFGMLVTHLTDTHPDFMENPPPIEDLEEFYVQAKSRFNEDEEFKTRSREGVTKLQAGDETSLAAWRHIVNASRNEFEKIYKRLSITNYEKGESFYNDRLPGIVEELQELGLVEENEGALCVFVDNPLHKKAKMVPLFMRKSDGGYGYATTDMAALKYRMVELGAHWNIYVVDSGQSDHFQRVFETGRRAGFITPDQRVEHVGFGLVLGADGKRFRTSAGGSVKLADLLDEAVAGAAEVHRAKLESKASAGDGEAEALDEESIAAVAEVIGIGCVKYADLHCHRTSDYQYSAERMLDQKGNTAVYLLYLYARVQSIMEKSGFDVKQLIENDIDVLKFVEEDEIAVAKFLITFPDVLNAAIKDLTPHLICDFIYELAVKASNFYTNVRVNLDKDADDYDEDLQKSRLIICELISSSMRTGFDLIGIRYLDHI